MTYKAYLSIAFLFISGFCFGQDKSDPDRPGESKTPELVKGNNLQFELGFRKEKLEQERYFYEHPEVVLRYGLFNALELRMTLVSQTTKDNINKDNLNGIAPVYFGVKAKILPQYNWLPSIGLLAQVGVPSLASSDYFVTGIPFEFRTLFNHNVGNFSLKYNFGVAWNETNDQVDNKQWMYSLTPSYRVSNSFHVFVEEYAFIRNGTSAEHYIDGGGQYFFSRNFAVDLSAGVGISEISSTYFIKGGLSYRLSFSGNK